MPVYLLLFLFSVSAMAQPAKPVTGPCGLLTKAEVQEAVGSPVSDGVPEKLNKLVCSFQLGETGSVVSVLLTGKAVNENAAKTVAELKKQKMNAEVVTGFGESAYASTPMSGMQQLGAYKGVNQVIVTVLIMGAPEAKLKSVVEGLMRKALARLP